jgi:hypothetical protein
MNKIKLKNLNYRGCYPRDLIPDMNIFDCCISNNKTSYDPNGEHWLALFKDSDNKIYIYDSFYRDTSIKGIDFPKKYIEFKYKNNNIDQEYYETNCGSHCISMIKICDLYGIKYIFSRL